MGTGDAVAAAEEPRRTVSGEPEAARGAEEQASPRADGGDAAAAGDASPDDASPRHKDKKHKKEKKHKHKEHKKEKRHHKEKRRHRDRSPGSDAEAEAGAADAPPAAQPVEESRGGEAPEPAAAPGAAKPAAAPATAAAAGGDEDAEEGELPGEALPAGDRGRDERGERRRRSRSRSAGEEGRDGGRRRRSRERSARSRSPQERPQRRDTSRAASEQQRNQQRDRSRDVSTRRRSRSRTPERRRSRSPPRRSRSPPRRRPSISRSPDRRRDVRAGLPPRDYRRDLDRERDRRGDYGRDRFSGPGGRFDDRRRVGFEERRRHSRSRSRSRDGRKRSRSEERRAHHKQQEEEEDEEEFQRRVAAALEAQQGEDEDRLIEERRRRRQEILAKHRSQQDLSTMAAAPTATELTQRPQQEGQPAAEGQQAEGNGQPVAGPAGASAPPSATGTPQRGRPASAAGEGGEAAGEDGEPELSDNEEAVMEELGTTQAGALDIFRHDGPGPEAGPESAAPSELPKSGMGEAVDTELGRRLQARVTAEPDMFAEDDIFAATPTDVKEKEAAAAAAAQAPGPNVAPAAGARKGLLDNYDDAEGYYNFQVGELIGEPGGPQYEVYATHGKGVFSSVLRARDLSRRDHDTGAIPEVAIKVIRANETMYKAGQMERVILRKLSEADVEGKRHCIRMLGSFEYRNHLCLVFEAMDMNLRELTKRYGRGIGLSINAVRVYAQQMLVSLYHLRNCGVLHADIKPDNILVNDRRTVVKLCDFGSAMFSGDNEITPYLVSRFYRAPEVILGLPYEYPMDMWSIGCVVYELFTGRILFPGKTNNEMLKLMMDVKGPFPKKMIKKAEFAFKHFEGDTNLSFALLEEDPVTKRPVRRLISNPTVKKDFGALLAGQSPDRRKLAQLIDLLERMMQLDPDKRITPKEALRHPFIKEPPAAPRAAK